MMITTAIESRTYLVAEPGNYKLHAARFIAKGEPVIKVSGTLSGNITRHSIQVSTDTHISADLYAGDTDITETHWRYINHSCSSSLWLRLSDMQMIALRDIEEGEELSYNYITTEWDMSCPFDCNCGSANCYGKVQGYKYLNEAQRKHIKAITAPHLLSLAKGK